MIKRYTLKNVYRGKVAQRYDLETAIDKQPVNGSLYLSFEGLLGDECADQQHHGGLERALHQYPLEHYAYWQSKYGDQINWQAPGMGENLSSNEMTEDTVCLGDRYQWGEAVIEVSQPRSPCYKLNKRWGVDELSVDMQDISRCGWLYRVIKPGMVSVNDPLEIISRIDNSMSIKEACNIFFSKQLDSDKLLLLKKQDSLSDSWMDKVNQRLSTNEIEDWTFRLLGP